MKYLLNTPYKGTRDYIQGGDLYNSINEILPRILKQENSYINQLSFSTFSYNLCKLILEEDINGQTIIGKGTITLDDNSKKKFGLIETTEIPSMRLPFDEESLVSQARFTDQSIELQGLTPFTSIETIVALTKALSNKEMPLEKGKWVFGKIDLTSALTSIKDSITIECINSVAGRFSVNKIMIDGKQVGKIQFIVGTP